MKASDWIAERLEAEGVTHVFEVVGGMIVHIVDSMHRRGAPRLVSVHHEQAAAFAAEGWARISGRPGVAMATSGPGATNLLTGIGSCYFDSVPTVFVTGQVNRDEQRGERPIRQLGFQETDIVAMAAPVTKAARAVSAPESLAEETDAAFALACEPRPGPVLLDIPMDVQRAEIDAPRTTPSSTTRPPTPVSAADIAATVDTLRRAARPLVLAGGGIRAAGATAAFRRVVEGFGVPVVHSLHGVDVLPYAHALRVGMIGSYGNRWANAAVARADALVVLGSRLDVRQTGSRTDAFAGDRRIVHVDCDPSEINNRVLGCVPVVADLATYLEALDAEGAAVTVDPAWLAEIDDLRRRWPDTAELAAVDGINPNELMHELSAASVGAGAFVVDVGQHQMWAAQSMEVRDGQRFLTSGGMGAMGFALPAAIGASFALGERPVVVVAGDGGFQLNVQELQTVARHGLPLKIVVVDNGCHGMVRQFQEQYMDGVYASTYWGYSAPDFAALARAYGIKASRVEKPAELADGLAAMWAEPSEPYLLHVLVDTFANAYPKMSFGLPMGEMEPEPPSPGALG